MESGLQLVVLLSVGLLGIGFAVLRKARHGAAAPGGGSLGRRRSSPRGAAIGALAALGVGVFASMREGRETTSAAGSVADTASALAQEGSGPGGRMVIAIAIGVLALAAGIITLIRSQNRQY